MSGCVPRQCSSPRRHVKHPTCDAYKSIRLNAIWYTRPLVGPRSGAPFLSIIFAIIGCQFFDERANLSNWTGGSEPDHARFRPLGRHNGQRFEQITPFDPERSHASNEEESGPCQTCLHGSPALQCPPATSQHRDRCHCRHANAPPSRPQATVVDRACFGSRCIFLTVPFKF